jgi:hypothetical protein
MRKLLGGATEDLREPPNSFLMRYARDVVAVKDVRQAIFAGVCLVVDHLRRPDVPPPSHNREQKEKCQDGCYNNRCQDLSSRARKSRCPSSQTRLRVDFKRESCSLAIIQNAPRLIEIIVGVPIRRMSNAMQWGPPPNILECRKACIKPLFF